jgi:hypothetical protein
MLQQLGLQLPGMPVGHAAPVVQTIPQFAIQPPAQPPQQPPQLWPQQPPMLPVQPTVYPAVEPQFVSKYATTDECGLEFLTATPSRPTQRVTFDLGPGGKHNKRYHAIVPSETNLLLVFDTRYDDDEFIPPSSFGGQAAGEEESVFTFKIAVETLQREFRCTAPEGLHFRIGRLSFIQLVICEED